jgi:hypothetical protein
MTTGWEGEYLRPVILKVVVGEEKWLVYGCGGNEPC